MSMSILMKTWTNLLWSCSQANAKFHLHLWVSSQTQVIGRTQHLDMHQFSEEQSYSLRIRLKRRPETTLKLIWTTQIHSQEVSRLRKPHLQTLTTKKNISCQFRSLFRPKSRTMIFSEIFCKRFLNQFVLLKKFHRIRVKTNS